MEKRQGVSVVLHKPSGKILMQLRDLDAHCHPNKWCFPGGRLDEGEDHEQAAIREVGEECDVVLDRKNLQFAFAFDHDGFKVDWFFVADVREDIATECFKGQRHEWKTLEEIGQLDNLTDWIREALPLLQSFLKNRTSPFVEEY